jgi:choline monooxygenase
VELISNVCRHRQAVMLKGRATPRPGRLSAAPLDLRPARPADRGAALREDPCLNLRNYPLQNWHGLLFEQRGRDVATDLAGWARRPSSTSRVIVFEKAVLHECNYNWKTFIEVYLEDYHVGPFHPGLGSFVTCDDLRWEFGSEHSVQTVGVHDAP